MCYQTVLHKSSIVSPNVFNLLFIQCHNLLSKHHVQQCSTVCSPNIHISLIRQMLSLCLCMYVCARTTVIQFNRSVLFSNQAKREGNTQWMRSADNGDYNECYRQNNKTITNFPETASKIISLILTCSDRASLETSYSCKVQPESSSRLRLREQSPAKALQSVLVRRTFGTSHMPSFNCP